MSDPSTRLIHPERPDLASVSPLTLPIVDTTTYIFENAAELLAYCEGRSRRFLYSRYANPTVVAAEGMLAALDGGDSALLFSSGMGATATTLLALVQAGDEVVCSAAVYGGTMRLLTDLLAQLGVRPRFVSLAELAEPERVLGTATRLLWFESPVNPTLRTVDVRRVAGACRARGVLSILDNTFASPINQRPLALGVDLAMQSATKYLNGHSDVTAGVVAGAAGLIDRIAGARRLVGTVVEARSAYELVRGLKTLPVRMARHNANAQAVAQFLAGDSRVDAVHYPGLPSDPDHAIAAGQMTGFGGMVAFDVGTYERAAAVYDRLTVIVRAASLGGVESLVSLPVLTSHWGYTDEQLSAAGISKGLVRLSVGLEDPADLVADLDQALGH